MNMMNNYADTKKALDKIRNEYGCKGEVIFRTALQYLVEYGQSMFGDEEWVETQLSLIDELHDKAEAEGKILYVGRELEKAVIECARELVEVNAYYLLIYVQKEVWLSNDGGIDYARAVELLKKCIYDIEEREGCEDKLLYQELDSIGFYDTDIEDLGFGYLLDEEEENND